jgi:PAS domain S-box-containing protein
VVHTGINFDEVRKEQRANLFKLLILVAALTAAAIWIVLILSHHFGREVRALATHLQGILNHAPVAIDICDRTGRILAFSEAFELLFGPPAVNQTSTQLFAERLSDTIVKRLAETDRKVFESGVPCELELQVDIQGRSCTWNVSNFPIARDNGGKTTLACTFIHDISERKAAEEALRLLNRELDRRVLARTAQLETANREMHDFTYTVSHDLRAPLRHIDGFMDLLQQKAGQALDEESRHYMAAVSDAAQKMGLLIDDLLAFSRMGRHAMFFQAVDLGTLVCEVMRELEPDTAGRNIDWRIGELPTVSADAALLRMVLSNLITNALKYTRPRGQAEIEIGCQAGEKETIFFIRDNGVGFDMTYGDKLFGVFQRLHRAEEFEGTGIGLATVRRIIARHGGRTWAEGKIDQGASFYFSLPDSPRGGGDEKP